MRQEKAILVGHPHANSFGGHADDAEEEQVEIDVARQFLDAETDPIIHQAVCEPGVCMMAYYIQPIEGYNQCRIIINVHFFKNKSEYQISFYRLLI